MILPHPRLRRYIAEHAALLMIHSTHDFFLRTMTDEILKQMSPLFDAMYAEGGRPSIPPEKLLRAQLLQMLYSVRSERLLIEEIDYSILFRWFGRSLPCEPDSTRRAQKTSAQTMRALEMSPG